MCVLRNHKFGMCYCELDIEIGDQWKYILNCYDCAGIRFVCNGNP